MHRLCLPVLLALLSGCAASSTPHYDARFGDAVREARRQMTLNPDAGANANATSGLDGRAAAGVAERYQHSFQTPPPVVNVINIGGGIGSGAGK